VSENEAVILLLVVLVGIPTLISIFADNAVETMQGWFDRSRSRRAETQRILDCSLDRQQMAPILQMLVDRGWTIEDYAGVNTRIHSPLGTVVLIGLAERSSGTRITVAASPEHLESVTGEILGVARELDPSARVHPGR